MYLFCMFLCTLMRFPIRYCFYSNSSKEDGQLRAHWETISWNFQHLDVQQRQKGKWNRNTVIFMRADSNKADEIITQTCTTAFLRLRLVSDTETLFNYTHCMHTTCILYENLTIYGKKVAQTHTSFWQARFRPRPGSCAGVTGNERTLRRSLFNQAK